MEEEPVILVRGVSKQYGKEPKILNDLDMTVLKGKIYGLLGASGCGKTTLLSSILGSSQIQSGFISIFGEPPGVVSVKSIGYMPQNIALVRELSIKNVLQQQGWIFGMSNKEIEERHKLCEKLLDLPPANKLIKNLSGGQQRRVSLAVVLLHDPELLILDEPTVGLDPLLRQNLWDYLIKITREEKKTVVITTHYIEEARQADMVGMLRHGKLIAEENPQALMKRLNFTSLEDLFVSLSVEQEKNYSIIDLQQNVSIISRTKELKILSQKPPKKSLINRINFINKGHTKALLSKNCIRYVRHPATILPTIFTPILMIASAFLAVGRIPDDLQIGIVNEELGAYKNCGDYIKNNTVGGHIVDEFNRCEFQGLSCKFTEQIESIIKNQVYFETMEEAFEAIRKKQIHQFLFFPHNFSEAYTAVTNLVESPEDFNFSNILFYRDNIHDPLGRYVEKQLHKSYLKFAEELAKDCNWDIHTAKYPVVFEEPIYGKAELTYSDFIAPGMMTIAIMFLPKAVAISTISSERTDGVWERTVISGVRPTEILLCHIITLSFTSAIQTLESFVFSYYVFGFECKGNILYAAALLFLMGLVGVTLGILLSVIFQSEMSAIFGALGIAFPLFMLNGTLWPVEGQPRYLRYISYVMPSTIPLESLNNIIFKGWGITNFNVYKGYIFTSSFICICTFLSVLGLKLEKKIKNK